MSCKSLAVSILDVGIDYDAVVSSIGAVRVVDVMPRGRHHVGIVTDDKHSAEPRVGRAKAGDAVHDGVVLGIRKLEARLELGDLHVPAVRVPPVDHDVDDSGLPPDGRMDLAGIVEDYRVRRCRVGVALEGENFRRRVRVVHVDAEPAGCQRGPVDVEILGRCETKLHSSRLLRMPVRSSASVPRARGFPSARRARPWWIPPRPWPCRRPGRAGPSG